MDTSLFCIFKYLSSVNISIRNKFATLESLAVNNKYSSLEFSIQTTPYKLVIVHNNNSREACLLFDNQLISIFNSTSSFFLSTQSTRLLTLINPTMIYNICIVFWIFWSVGEYLPIFLCFIEIGKNWKYRTSKLPKIEPRTYWTS